MRCGLGEPRPTTSTAAAHRLPSPAELQLETVESAARCVLRAGSRGTHREAAGRIAAEQITPYPPGIPAVVPGERLNDAVLEYLRSGVTPA